MVQSLSENKTLDSLDQPPVAVDSSLGIFTAVALILLLWGFCWLKEVQPWRAPQRINVVFSDIAGLNDNAGVYVNGVRIGMVDSLEWRSEERVLVRLRITSNKVVVPQGSKYEILTNGVIGAKYVQIDLPRLQPGEPPLPPVSDKMEVQGEPTIRPELAVNKLAITLSQIDVEEMERNFVADRKRLVRAADQLAILADKTMPLVDRGLPLEDEMLGLSKDLRKTTRKVARLVDDPEFSSDLKTTAQSAKETAQSLQSTVHELNTTLADKPLRQDLLQAFSELHQSTINVEKSLDSLKQITGDKELRADVKETLSELHSTLDRADQIISKPMGSDARSTLQKARDLISDLDQVSVQLHQVLDKRSPILHLLIGRPGKIKGDEQLLQNK